ncbi:glycosyl hydrolase family 8 [Deinococcus geothermalis]|uniref:glycosyl hydrolase family 8 n=1 Tax=Deinococcus geothermalis TaxID=68909 RepID=UPI0023522C1D|nr:glycosyl hydrolase family 8 [Deinococcus geothermalis]
MKRSKTHLAVVGLGLLALLGSCGQSVPGPQQNAAFYTGKYRNLFTEWSIATEAQVQAKLDAYWESLFASTDDQRRVYYPAGSNANGPMAYVADIGSNDVRTEGMSYGMMIAVQMNKQAEFNALWNYAKSKMQHQSGPRAGYFAWHTDFEGNILDANPASDGEEYFATALFFASHRWGDGNGIYNYSAEANNILNTMLHKEDMNGGVVNGVTNMFDREHKQVVFVPEGDNAIFTDPSYHLPAFYELWSRWATGWNGQQAVDRKFWAEAAQVSRDYFQKATHPETGLAPDYAEFDGTPKGPAWNPDAANFRFDAWRTAVNWSVDQAWWGKDSRETALTDKLQSFFERQGIGTYVNQYTVSGTPLPGAGRSTGLIATNGAASIATDTPRARQFTQELWKLEPPTGKWRYYDGMMNFMSLLHASGHFRIY